MTPGIGNTRMRCAPGRPVSIVLCDANTPYPFQCTQEDAGTESVMSCAVVFAPEAEAQLLELHGYFAVAL